MNEIPTCTYKESYEDDFIKLVIGGLYLPGGKTDPIEMIWSAVRKKGIREYEVDAYLDVSIDGLSDIICVFHPNLAVGEKHKKDKDTYTQYFKQIFPCLLVDFTEVVDAFSTDCAFTKYKRTLHFCKDEGTRKFKIKKTMDEFLKKMNLKK